MNKEETIVLGIIITLCTCIILLGMEVYNERQRISNERADIKQIEEHIERNL